MTKIDFIIDNLINSIVQVYIPKWDVNDYTYASALQYVLVAQIWEPLTTNNHPLLGK